MANRVSQALAHVKTPRYPTSIISPTAFVAFLLPKFTVNRPLRPECRTASSVPPLHAGSAEDFDFTPRQYQLFRAKVRLAALLGHGSELSIGQCALPSDAARIPAAHHSEGLTSPFRFNYLRDP